MTRTSSFTRRSILDNEAGPFHREEARVACWKKNNPTRKNEERGEEKEAEGGGIVASLNTRD